jgi:hypothetical protein
MIGATGTSRNLEVFLGADGRASWMLDSLENIEADSSLFAM